MSNQSQSAGFTTWLLLFKYELLTGLRTAAWRGIALAALLYGLSLGHVDGTGCGVTALDAGETGCRLFALVTAVWMSLAAVRDTATRTRVIVQSRPQRSETLASLRFTGAFVQALGLLAALFVGAALARIIGGSGLLQVGAFVPQFIRASGVCLFSAALSFALASLSESPIAGLLGGLYSLLVLAGKEYLARLYDPAPVQNLSAYVAVSLFILMLTMRFSAARRRGSSPPPLLAVPGALLSLAAAILLFTNIARSGHDPHIRLNPTLELMAAQDTQAGARAAGFLFPDQHGNPTSLADYPGKVLVIALLSPHDVDTGSMLTALNALQKKYGARGVQVVGVCLSEDNSAAPALAIGEGLVFPLVTDWGTSSVPEKLAMSPLAGAYRATALPSVAVTDRRRRIIDIVRGASVTDGRSVTDLVEQALKAEPNWQ